MKEYRHHPSFLPYLHSVSGKFGLRLQKSGSLQPEIPPFQAVDDNDPLARIFPGAFVTDNGSVIRKVNLLIQRESVDWSAGGENVFTNAMVDHYWQQALNSRLARSGDTSMLLAAQLDGQQFLAFAPLFFCRREKIFFEPPCPGCGKPLQLCQDDDLLQAAGLPPYSTGFRRYLFCPSCGERAWYSLERSADDPPTVHDCRQLMLEFSGIDQSRAADTSFPCATCGQREQCFGSGQAVCDALFVLSFYPFYLLICDCDSLDGFHMLSVLQSRGIPLPQVSSDPQSPVAVTSADEKKEEPSQDLLIHGIMEKLVDKYEQEAVKQPVFSSAADISQTATLSIPADEIQDDLSLETVIIGASGGHSPASGDTLQTDTVLLSAAPPAPAPAAEETQNSLPPDDPAPVKTDIDAGDDLAETVIIRPGTKI